MPQDVVLAFGIALVILTILALVSVVAVMRHRRLRTGFRSRLRPHRGRDRQPPADQE